MRIAILGQPRPQSPEAKKLGLPFPFNASQAKGWAPSILGGLDYVQVVIFI